MKKESKTNFYNKKERNYIITLLSGVGTIALATTITVPVVYACKPTTKPTQDEGKPIPLTTDYYNISEQGTDVVTINNFSQACLDDPSLLSQYDTFKMGDYKSATSIRIQPNSFASTTPSSVSHIKKLLCSNTSCEVSFLDYALRNFAFEELDFGNNEVWASAQSFECLDGTPTIKKVILSPKTTLSANGGTATDVPFLYQTNLSTIDVSRFTTETEINDANWISYYSNKIWGSSGRAASGTIIISNSSLETAWATKFADAGLTVDGTNWKFQVK